MLRDVYYSDHVIGVYEDEDFVYKRQNKLHVRGNSFAIPDWHTHEKNNRSGRLAYHIENKPRCYYCKGRLDFFGEPPVGRSFLGIYTFIGECSQCGWWFCNTGKYLSSGQDPDTYEFRRFYEGVLRKFDVSGSSIPLEALNAHLSRNFEDIKHVHPNKFEDIAQGVFSDFFDCEVRQTARTRDGGIDLFVVRTNDPIVIQLKRRSQKKTEGVQAIREFLGAMVSGGQTRGLFVSTAEDYSHAAKKTALGSEISSFGLRLDLMNYSEVRELFVPRLKERKPWLENDGIMMPTAKEPFKYPWPT